MRLLGWAAGEPIQTGPVEAPRGVPATGGQREALRASAPGNVHKGRRNGPRTSPLRGTHRIKAGVDVGEGVGDALDIHFRRYDPNRAGLPTPLRGTGQSAGAAALGGGQPNPPPH